MQPGTSYRIRPHSRHILHVKALLRLCSKMCSRPCLRIPTRYKKGETNSPVPPTVSYYLQLLPMVSAHFLSDSKSRGRKVMRVRPPPPAPSGPQRPTEWLASFIEPGAHKGVEPASGAEYSVRTCFPFTGNSCVRFRRGILPRSPLPSYQGSASQFPHKRHVKCAAACIKVQDK